MTTARPLRVAIAGAAGRVGYALSFRIANGGLFGNENPVALSLLDLPEKQYRLDGQAMELIECAFPLLADLRAGSDPVAMFQGADWVILMGGMSFQSNRQDRLELLRANAPIMIDHGRAINRACPSARVLVLTSPCNTNCLIAMTQAQDSPKEHWFALNQVIRSRAIALVAAKAGVPVTQVTRLTVWGNNSETAYIDLHNSRIGDQPACQILRDPEWCATTFAATIAHRYREIFRGTGESPAGSTAHAILATIRAITTPTPFTHWFGAGVLSDGSYHEVPRGLVFGFPLLTANGEAWEIPKGHYLDDIARERIAQNVAELELEASSVSHLLGKS